MAYQSGYEKARALNPELAAKYIKHTAVGDPEADAVADALASFDQTQMEATPKTPQFLPPNLRKRLHGYAPNKALLQRTKTAIAIAKQIEHLTAQQNA